MSTPFDKDEPSDLESSLLRERHQYAATYSTSRHDGLFLNRQTLVISALSTQETSIASMEIEGRCTRGLIGVYVRRELLLTSA